MKKVFMPSMDGLQEMQSLGADVYSYILIKTVEKFIVEGINYTAKGILNPDCTRKYILEDPEIVLPICKLYPELISRFDFASNDTSFCLELLNNHHEETYTDALNNLSYFDNSVTCKNKLIVKDTIEKLSKELVTNPKYRFTFKNSALLDRIFDTTIISKDDIYLSSEDRLKLLSDLSSIEPYYVLKRFADEELIAGYYPSELSKLKKENLNNAMTEYKRRYNLPEENYYREENIFTEDNTKVKRLIRQIKSDPALLYKNND